MSNVCCRKNKCSTEGSSCEKKKCCPCRCILKIVLSLLFLSLFNFFFVKFYIKGHGQEIVDAVNASFAKQKEEKMANSKKNASVEYEKLIKDSSVPFIGDKNSNNIIIEIFDYNCGYCKKANDEIRRLFQKRNDVKVLLINAPIMSEASLVAAKASIAVFAKDPEHFDDFHFRLMNHKGQISPQDVYDIAQASTKGRYKAVKDEMESKKTEEAIQASYDILRSLSIQGTPAFIIAGDLIPGFVPAEELLKRLK
ncbi:DsbA family protein [Candidatus Deianiraea vastatrix]|nr:DsbA family protein [Candidatus Deianiraea vastatrix]